MKKIELNVENKNGGLPASFLAFVVLLAACVWVLWLVTKKTGEQSYLSEKERGNLVSRSFMLGVIS